ncbi:arginine--tRNA ligase [Paenibacillus humicola]|uniref:arginine--tRNA ligase n=1 Tax=Paenibacillus humicola TaxID=3110540 RepID=UPI00237C31E5|nr:arginine--tRNA ligase [Paenibacillus humicola]
MSLLLKWAAAKLEGIVPLPEDNIYALLELPPRPELGDAAFPCFTLARPLAKPPARIAAELAERLNGAGGEGIRAEAAGPYLNLFFEPACWGPKLMEAALDPAFGTSDRRAGERVVIDLSSPNIAKPFGVGHLRSTMIGSALARLYRASGYDVVTVNHIGDWGTQFGKLLEAYLRWGDEEALKRDPIRESLKLYVRFHEEAERDPQLEEEGRRRFWMLENGDPEALRLWRFFVTFSMEEFERVYARLGVTFDHTLGESFYNGKMDAVVRRLAELGLLEESDGAQVVRLDDKAMPPCLIVKSDGTTIYGLRDLATALYRRREMGADRLLYVVGAEQSLHFSQVFEVLRRMGEPWAEQCRHIAFGLMKLEGRKMSTRRGQVVYLDDVLDEAVRRAEAIIAEKNPSLRERRETAEAVGIGAVVFGDLKNGRMLEVDFSLDEALRFEGETGPYVQYAAARAYRLLDASGLAPESSFVPAAARHDGPSLTAPSAWDLLKALGAYPEAVAEAVRLNEPSVLARYLLDAAKRFNRFYHQERIMTSDAEETAAKLRLAAACAGVLESGLGMLGIRAPRQI